MDTEAGIKSKFYSNEFKANNKNNIKFKIASKMSLSLSLCSAEHHILEDIASMIQFNIIRSSSTAKPVSAFVN